MTMISTIGSLNRSLVINFFREYFQALLVQKAIALSGQPISLSQPESELLANMDVDEETLRPTPESSSEISPPITPGALKNPVSLTNQIQLSLQQVLSDQMATAIKQGGEYVAAYYQEAQYLMVAYTDEVFLNLNWGEQKIWENNLFESRMYNTHVAGSAVFDRLDIFLKTRDPATRDIASIYLWILGLGFKGKYRNDTNQTPIAQYRKRLYKFITDSDPAFTSSTSKSCSEAYNYTIKDSMLLQLPNPKWYNWSFWIVILLFFIISYIVWLHETSPLRETIHEIISLEQQGIDK